MEEPVNSIENALKLCGVTETTLTRAEKDMLDEKGYMVLPGAISSPTLEQMRDIFESAFVGECSAKVDRPQTGTRHVEFKFEDNPAGSPMQHNLTDGLTRAQVLHRLRDAIHLIPGPNNGF